MMNEDIATNQSVPFTGLRDAIRCRERLAEAIGVLIKEYERQVPHTRVEAIQISRTEVTGRLGSKRSQMVVLPRVVLTN